MNGWTWKCERPGSWVGTFGANVATARKIREGIIHGAEWMWLTKVNDEWIDNASTLADAKRSVESHSPLA